MFAPAQRGFPVDKAEFLALVAQSLNLGLGGRIGNGKPSHLDVRVASAAGGELAAVRGGVGNVSVREGATTRHPVQPLPDGRGSWVP